MPGEGKSDMERLGVFKEMGYVSIGDKYVSSAYRPFNEAAYHDRQMQVGVARRGCALQSGYFEPEYRRIFEREALTDPMRRERLERLEQGKKILSKAFLPCSGTKRPSGLGSFYGTLSGPVEAMSPLKAPGKPRPSPGRNIITNPPKKGSGGSYPNVTLSKMELYASDPYHRAMDQLKREVATHRSKLTGGPFKLHLHPKDYFQGNPYLSDRHLPPSVQKSRASAGEKHFPVPFKPTSPSKRMGGMKAGTFGVFPSHSADPYVAKRPRPSTKPANRDEVRVFRPAPGPKSTPVQSIISLNINRSVHSANYTSTIPAIMTY